LRARGTVAIEDALKRIPGDRIWGGEGINNEASKEDDGVTEEGKG